MTCQEKKHLPKHQESLFPLNSVITLEPDKYFTAYKESTFFLSSVLLKGKVMKYFKYLPIKAQLFTKKKKRNSTLHIRNFRKATYKGEWIKLNFLLYAMRALRYSFPITIHSHSRLVDKVEHCEHVWLISVFIVKIVELSELEFKGWFKEIALSLKTLIIYRKWCKLHMSIFKLIYKYVIFI